MEIADRARNRLRNKLSVAFLLHSSSSFVQIAFVFDHFDLAVSHRVWTD